MTERLLAVDSDDRGFESGLQDTVLILQEEIARLEEELRLYQDQSHVEVPSVLPLNGAVASPGAAQAVSDLRDDLARRDETIALLVDQVRALEETQLAVHD